MLVFFLLIAAVVVALAIVAVRNINRSVASSDWVNHTHSVILQVEALRSEMYVAEGALHTYVLDRRCPRHGELQGSAFGRSRRPRDHKGPHPQ